MRQIVLDTETTGLETRDDHRIIEIGCVELRSRRATGNNFWHYLQPDRLIDEGAIAVHGITNEMLAEKPRFADVAEEFVEYLRGAELIIHNAAFDVGFLDHEFAKLETPPPPLAEWCTITDTLTMAREMHPGQRNSLDALCKRYDVDNSGRDLHGALLDAQLLAEVYLAMTGGQQTIELAADEDDGQPREVVRLFQPLTGRPRVIRASDAERAEHASRVQAMVDKGAPERVWPD